jgi:hypothetical protein
MIKFNRAAGNTYLTMPDAAALTWPNGDFCVSWIIKIDGLVNDNSPQYFLSNGGFQTSGSLNVAWFSPANEPPSKIRCYVESDGPAAPRIDPASGFSSGIKLFVLQRSGSTLTLRSCPILADSPTSGAAVVLEATAAVTTALNGTGAMTFGGRSDLVQNRMFDQSICRVFRFDGALSDLEIAKLAHGMEINDLGKTPAWYLRMTDAADIADRGSQANVVSKGAGELVTTSEPAFGYAGAASAPTITSAPVVTGTPRVGDLASTVAFTPGAATGSPAPTITYQGKLEGVNIAPSYQFVSGDLGKLFTVAMVASNGNSPDASVTSSGVNVAAATTGTVDVTDVTANRIFQRVSGTSSIPLALSFAGVTPNAFDAQLYAENGTTVLQAWTALTGLSIGSGTATGNLVANQGGMYRIAVRSRNSATVIGVSAVKSNLFGVGDLVACIGSSSAEKWFDIDSGNATPSANVRVFDELGWQPMGTIGGAITLANSMAAAANVPIGMLDYGVGGSQVAEWINTGYGGWTAFTSGVTAAGSKLAAVISSMGSNDAGNNNVASTAAHATNLRLIASRIRTLTGQSSLPFMISGTNGRGPANEAAFIRVREAERIVSNDANNTLVQTIDLEVSGDSVHLTQSGFIKSLLRIGATLIPLLYQNGTVRRGPKITSFRFAGSTVRVGIAYAGGSADFTPTSGITGFTASDASGTLTIASATRTSASEILLTMNRPIVAPLVVQHLGGSRPIITAPALDNGTVPLPLESESSMATTASASLVTLSMQNRGGAIQANLSGLKWAFFDQATPDALTAPVAKGAVETTDSSGNIVIDITGTSLAPGEIGFLMISDSDGTTTQNSKAMARPVVVA